MLNESCLDDVLGFFDDLDAVLKSIATGFSATNWKNTEVGYEGIFELAGFEKEDVSVKYFEDDDLLTIEAKVKEDDILTKLNKKDFSYKCKFEEKLEDILVNLKNGILIISIQTKPKKVKTINIS